MSMGVDKIVGLGFHGGFYICVIYQGHQKLVFKGIVGLCIPRIGRVKNIWDKLFYKLIVSFCGLVSRKKFLLGSIHRIDTHIDMVVEVIEVQGSATFELYLDEEFI